MKNAERIGKAVEKVFAKYASAEWFEWKLSREEEVHYKQKSRGRPGKNTEYVRTV